MEKQVWEREMMRRSHWIPMPLIHGSSIVACGSMADERQNPKPRIPTIMGLDRTGGRVEDERHNYMAGGAWPREDGMEGEHVTGVPLEGRLLICRTELMIGESGA
jgi:hypothetical protein